MLYSDIPPINHARAFVKKYSKHNILTEAKGYNIIRFVTHKDIKTEDVEYTIERLNKISNKIKK